MPGTRKWVSELLLRSPAPLRSLRDVPVLGDFIHRLSHQVVPPGEKVWAQVQAGPARGLWLELNPRTGQSYLCGEAEVAPLEILAAQLRPGMIFYDLGANIGLFSLLAAHITGETGRVFSFEPDAEVATRLRRNVTRNGFANVTIIETGVWSTSGNMNFIAADSSSPDQGTGRFMGGDASGEIAGKPTRCIALDDFIKTAPLPDAIKCDVEGAELEVLRGAENLLRMRRPWILCEVHSDANDHAVREFLSGFGYLFESIDRTHLLALP